MKTKLFLLGALIFCGAFSYAAPVAEEKANEVILRNNGAEYKFLKSKFYCLTSSSYKGRPIWVKGFGLTYNLRGDKWYWETKPHEFYKMAPRTYKIIKKGDTLTFATRGEGKNMTLIRNFTLRGNSPDLEVLIRLEVRNKNDIAWLNLFSTTSPVTNEAWMLFSRDKQGKVVTTLEKAPHIFLDPVTKKYRVEGNYTLKEYRNESLFCSYDPKNNAGAVLMQIPERSRLPLRVGRAYLSSTELYSNVSPTYFCGTEKNSHLEAHYKVAPFIGSPAQLNKKLIPEYVAKMQKYYDLPKSFETGLRLKGTKDLALWSDLSSQKVYPTALPPKKSASQVELFAARGEGEGFNLALRSAKGVKNITWELPKFPFKAEAFPVAFTKRDYIRKIIAEHPDVLLEEKKFDLAPNRTGLLYVKFSVPEKAKAGVYKGVIKLFADKKPLAQVPVKLTVRDFSIEERTLTAAHDFWWRKYGYNKDKYQQERAKIEKMVVDARGGGRWLSHVKVTFDKEGNLIKADYTAFDKSVDLYTKIYKQPILIARSFMLGYGHVPRKNLFGEAKDIMTPVWKKKVLSFAKDFRKHLQKKNISHRIIMDLFDEPNEAYCSMINETITMLRSVAPEWRYTYAGNFHPAMAGYVDFWNTGCTISRREASMIKAKGGEYSYYNPPVYQDNGELVKIRGYYNYLWNEKVRYVYQWVINCWSESGNTGWDSFRNASWVVPSPKGPLSTLRMENTREGIEDYEYCVRLEKESARLAKKAPALVKEAKELLKSAAKLTGRSAKDDLHIVISNDPMAYETLHRKAGALLEKMAKIK